MDQVKRLGELLGDFQSAHSDFQIDRFIIAKNGGGTEYGRYKQALRELDKRYRALKVLAIDGGRLQVDIDETKQDIENNNGTNRFEVRRLQIDLTEHLMTLDNHERKCDETEREFARFFAIASQLKDSIGDLTQEKRDELEHEFWLSDLGIQAGIDMRTTGRLSAGVLGVILSLEDADRVAILDDMDNGVANLIVDGYGAPAIDFEGEVDVKALVYDD